MLTFEILTIFLVKAKDSWFYIFLFWSHCIYINAFWPIAGGYWRCKEAVLSWKQKSQPWPKHSWCKTKCVSFGPFKNGVPKADAHFQNSRRVSYENAKEVRNIYLISPEVRAQNSLWKKSDWLWKSGPKGDACAPPNWDAWLRGCVSIGNTFKWPKTSCFLRFYRFKNIENKRKFFLYRPKLRSVIFLHLCLSCIFSFTIIA